MAGCHHYEFGWRLGYAAVYERKTTGSCGGLVTQCCHSHLVFFFSSRRRHTRCSRDWSSDVCSSDLGHAVAQLADVLADGRGAVARTHRGQRGASAREGAHLHGFGELDELADVVGQRFLGDRKSTRLNSSHGYISYAVFCLKKKKHNHDSNALYPPPIASCSVSTVPPVIFPSCLPCSPLFSSRLHWTPSRASASSRYSLIP